MRYNLINGQAVVRVGLDELTDKISCSWIHSVPRLTFHWVIFRLCILNVLLLRTPKGGLAAQYDIRQHT